MSKQHITTSKRLIQNTLFNVVTVITTATIGFFLIRFFLGQLGENKYGIWVLVGSIFQYRIIMSLGLNAAINRYIPAYIARDDRNGIQKVISTSLFFYSTLTVVIVLVSLVIYCKVGSWFIIDPDLVGIASTLVLVVGFCAAFAMMLQLYSAILAGLQRYDVINLILLVTLLLRTALLVALLSKGWGLITMGFLYGFSEIAIRVTQFVFVKRLLPEASLSLANIDFKLLREMTFFGIYALLYTTGAILIYRASSVVIGVFLGTAEISQFAVVVACLLILSQLVQAFARAIMPAVSDLYSREEHARVREIAILTQKYSLLLVVPSGCFLVTMGKEFLQVWVGKKFQDPATVDSLGAILALLTVSHCLRLAQHSNYLVLLGRGQHKVLTGITFLMALVCVTASVVSVKMYDFGLLGVAWSNFIPMALTYGFIIPMYCSYKLHLSILYSARKVLSPVLLGTLPTIAMIIVWKCLYPPTCWFHIGTVILSAALLTAVASWLFSFSELERQRFLKILLPRLQRS